MSDEPIKPEPLTEEQAGWILRLLDKSEEIERLSDAALSDACSEEVWALLPWCQRPGLLFNEMISRFDRRAGIVRGEDGEIVAGPCVPTTEGDFVRRLGEIAAAAPFGDAEWNRSLQEATMGIENLALLLRRAARKLDARDPLRTECVAYLKRIGRAGQPLREKPAP